MITSEISIELLEAAFNGLQREELPHHTNIAKLIYECAGGVVTPEKPVVTNDGAQSIPLNPEFSVFIDDLS